MKKILKIICIVFSFIFALSVFPVSSLAVGSSNPMHGTDVMDDLKQMGYTDLSSYVLDTSNDMISIVDFTEYGYDYWGDQRYYGIYLYLYNASGKPLQTYGNSVELSYISKSGEQAPFSKHPMEILSVSSEGDYKNLFYKVYLSTSSVIAKDIAQLSRTYFVSSIEARYKTNEKVNSYISASMYNFQGFQQYFGVRQDDKTSLYRSYESIEVIETELHPASFFTNTANICGLYGHEADCVCEDYRWEISSVYFNIPNYFINKYGNLDDDPKDGGTSGLYSVQGEYYKYVTDGILTTSSDAYKLLKEYQNKNLWEQDGYSNYSVGEIGFYNYDHNPLTPEQGSDLYSYFKNFDLTYNMFIGEYKRHIVMYTINSSDIQQHICNVLLSDSSEVAYVSQKSFLDSYNASGKPHYVTTDGLSYKNAETFKSLGYQTYNISVEDSSLNKEMPVYASTNDSWLHKLFNKNLYSDEDGYPECKPIVEIKSSDVNYVDATKLSKAEDLFIMSSDIENLKGFYDDYNRDNHIYLMRIGVNPYYAPKVTITKDTKIGPAETGKEFAEGYYFEKAVYHDFDILSFTFKDADSDFHTVPVSCNPIDIVGAVIPGNNNDDSVPNGDESDKAPVEDGNSWLLIVLFIAIAFLLLFILWRVFGSFIGAVMDRFVQFSKLSADKKQRKIDNYEIEQKIKEDKAKKRAERKSKKKASDMKEAVNENKKAVKNTAKENKKKKL